MKIVLTQHALVRLQERSLAQEWVERIARAPDWVEPDSVPGISRLFGAVPAAGGRILRVAVADRRGIRYVLSAHFDRAARRKS